MIDAQNRVWVSNSASNTLVRFPASDPSKVETFHAGLSVRALALDQKGNLWVTSNLSPDFPAPKMPPHATIMEQFKIIAGAALMDPKPTGVVNMIQPDGTQVVPGGYTGNGTVDAPWGVNIDGNGDVWVGMIKNRSIVVLAGDDTKGHPAGTKAGDLIHQFTGGNIQMITDVNIDPAGDVWIANNWNSIDAATAESPLFATSTWGGGSGLTVIYGVASPVKRCESTSEERSAVKRHPTFCGSRGRVTAPATRWRSPASYGRPIRARSWKRRIQPRRT